MSSTIQNLNKMLESRVRLGIMSALAANDSLDFNSLKEMLDVTDGNLASHASALEDESYIKVKKEFVAKKPQTTYMLTAAGRRAFSDHINALEQLIKNSK
jgi:DNA-binding MarR family transcriptional regulator